MLSQLVSCIGCRRSVEGLYQDLTCISKDFTLEPLIISTDGSVTINKEHMEDKERLTNLLCGTVERMTEKFLKDNKVDAKGKKKGTRCPQHSSKDVKKEVIKVEKR